MPCRSRASQRRNHPLPGLAPGQPTGRGSAAPRLSQAHLHAAPRAAPPPKALRTSSLCCVCSTSPSYCLKHALCPARGSVCSLQRRGAPFSQEKGNPGTTPLPDNLSFLPGSPPAVPLTMPFPTEAIGTVMRRPFFKVLPTHLSPHLLSSSAVMAWPLPPVPTDTRAPGS